MTTYFKTLLQAQEYVDSKYPHLKVFAQAPTIGIDCGVVIISFGHVSFWQEPSLVDGALSWMYNY